MMMVLSCCDLLVVLTSHPFLAFVTMLWFTEKINVYPGRLFIPSRLLSMFLGFSLLALFVMNVDRYLATHYPIFHRTSVTKGKLLTLFTVLVIFEITLVAMSMNDLVISYQVGVLVFCVIFIPSMLFINYKLFTVARKSRKNNEIPPDMKKSFSFKNISSCLLVVVCLFVLSIPTFIYIALRLTSKETESTLDNAQIAGLWARSIATMNSSFNCLIFYWKDKTLRAEGMKVIKSMKICRRSQSLFGNGEQRGNEEKKKYIYCEEERHKETTF